MTVTLGVSLQKQAENTQKEAMRRVFGGPVLIPISRNKNDRDHKEGTLSCREDNDKEEENEDEDDDEEGILEWVLRVLLVIPLWFLQFFRRILNGHMFTTPKITSKDS